MIEAKEAIDTAFSKIYDYYDESQLKDLLLEEVIFDNDLNTWLITLGFYVPNTNKKAYNSIQMIVNPNNFDRLYERKYKQFEISAESGTVLSMKIRDGN